MPAPPYSCWAAVNWLRPMMAVLSNISLPGPKAEHCSFLPLQLECSPSQGAPVSRQRGPAVLGETSPRLVAANAWRERDRARERGRGRGGGRGRGRERKSEREESPGEKEKGESAQRCHTANLQTAQNYAAAVRNPCYCHTTPSDETKSSKRLLTATNFPWPCCVTLVGPFFHCSKRYEA